MYSLSVKLAADLSDVGDHVNGSSSDYHGWLSCHAGGGSLVNLVRGDSVNLVTVLVEGKVSKSHEVSSNFFKSLVLPLHSHQNVHLEDVLSSGEFLFWNWFTESVELLHKGAHKLG